MRSQHALLRKGIVLCLQCGDKFIELNINEEDVRTRQVGDNGIRQQNIYVFSLLATLFGTRINDALFLSIPSVPSF